MVNVSRVLGLCMMLLNIVLGLSQAGWNEGTYKLFIYEPWNQLVGY